MQTIGQELRISRAKAIAIGVAEIVAVGVITILGYSVLKNFHPLAFIASCRDKNILDSLDFISNNVMMPIGAIFTCMLVVSVVGLERFSQELRSDAGRPWRREYIFQLCMTLLVIPALLVILLNAIGILT